MKRYEKFADEIAALIRSGVLAPGAKVPSVRPCQPHLWHQPVHRV